MYSGIAAPTKPSFAHRFSSSTPTDTSSMFIVAIPFNRRGWAWQYSAANPL